MDTQKILVSLIAALVLTAALTVVVSAQDEIAIGPVTINGVELEARATTHIGLIAGDSVPVRVLFQVRNASDKTYKDVKVKAWLSGSRTEISDSTDVMDVKPGRTYTSLLSLQMPSDIDPEEEYTLKVSVEGRDVDVDESFTVVLQRESYNLGVLSVETENSVVAGDDLKVEVVVKNKGLRDLEDVYVIARIPALGIEKRAYVTGDLVSDATCDEDDETKEDCNDKDESDDDSSVKVMTLTIPANAEPGVYSLEVVGYTSDDADQVKKNVIVEAGDEKNDVLTAVTSKQLASGEETTFDLIIVNTGSKLGVYEIVPESVNGVAISVAEPIATVSPESSKVVKVTAKAVGQQGTYTFGVNVNSGNELVKRVTYTVEVAGRKLTEGVAVLTVVLAIIFVVLLIVLIVLLTRKPQRLEETGESYY